MTSIATLFCLLSSLNHACAFQVNGGRNDVTAQFSKTTSTSLHASVKLEEPPTPAKPADETTELPPLLQKMVDERREYELNLGKAMDTLRSNYPYMLKRKPDFSIYHDDIRVTDPSGVQLNDLNSYKNSFRFLQACIGLFYNTDRSSIQYRMVYDFARQSIRISWNAMLVPKIVGNRRNALYIDGISVYDMDSESGKIIEHRIEQLLINSTPVEPPYGILTALSQEILNSGQRVPVGAGVMIGSN